MMPPHLLFIRQISCGLMAGWSGLGDPSVVSSWGDVPGWEATTVLEGGKFGDCGPGWSSIHIDDASSQACGQQQVPTSHGPCSKLVINTPLA